MARFAGPGRWRAGRACSAHSGADASTRRVYSPFIVLYYVAELSASSEVRLVRRYLNRRFRGEISRDVYKLLTHKSIRSGLQRKRPWT